VTQAELKELIREVLKEVTSEKQRDYMCVMKDKPKADRPKGLSRAEADEMCRSLEEYGYTGGGEAPTDPAGALAHKVGQMSGQLDAPGGLSSGELKRFVSYLQKAGIDIDSIDAETRLIRGPGGRVYSLKRLHGLFQDRERLKGGF